MVRRAYVQGLIQRRVKYRFDLPQPMSIKQWLQNNFEELKRLLESDWNAEFCPASPPPDLGSLLINWRGGHLVADVSICAPISRPWSPPISLEIPVKRIDICVEPVAPVTEAVEYVKIYTPGVKLFGRVTLRKDYAVVKHKGLFFAVDMKYKADPRGGIVLQVPRYKCASYEAGAAMRRLKNLLEIRR
ncbi:hypothetical protein [Pyrobaculum aerophilum]|uniref:Uncharacterized protein n=2 Tax=Pyrobaculum aerophilum TaxID=13773 RepID=Q8ZX32_PYRAE|nr:hypothetical protein [Pyrobaculum aerophilum]AAL63517.1 hypothetical protein PAE1496 [Pyrobaculum aerophilum str. IM2]MCX8135987.1 hypothetical protein [Pyrobaculum aerophilum]HII46385.1 hypothetical protein [Pyrobaculum aerophilum]